MKYWLVQYSIYGFLPCSVRWKADDKIKAMRSFKIAYPKCKILEVAELTK